MTFINEVCKCGGIKATIIMTLSKNYYTKLGIIINKKHQIYGCSICKQSWYIYVNSSLMWSIIEGINFYD